MSGLLDCGHEPTPTPGTTGYGNDRDGKSWCFACCAYLDKADMIETGKAVLYLVPVIGPHPYNVTNWPGSLALPVRYVRRSKGFGFGMPYPVVNVWFTGPDGKPWIGRHAGNNNTLVRCKRLAR